MGKRKAQIIKQVTYLLLIALLGCQPSLRDLQFERNLIKGIELSRLENKPVLLHFTCYGCMGYNEFYYDLLPSKAILNTLMQEYVTVELYVDDKKEISVSDTLGFHQLGFSESTTARFTQADDLGDLYAAIQKGWTVTNSQPQYLVVDADLNILIKPFGYTGRDEKLFLRKLEEGLSKYEER